MLGHGWPKRSRAVNGGFTDLTDHDGESKDANKVINELEADFKDSGWVGQSSNGDQCLHGKVVTADVPAGMKTVHRFMKSFSFSLVEMHF